MMNTSNPSFFPLVRTWDQLEDPHRSNVSFIFFIASPFKFITVASSITSQVVNSNFSPTCLNKTKQRKICSRLLSTYSWFQNPWSYTTIIGILVLSSYILRPNIFSINSFTVTLNRPKTRGTGCQKYCSLFLLYRISTGTM